MPDRDDAMDTEAHTETIQAYEHMVGTMSRRDRTLLFFALQAAMQRDFLADPGCDRRYVEAAFLSLAQFGTLMVRARGYMTTALGLDRAIARAAGLTERRH